MRSRDAIVRHEVGQASALVALGVLPDSIDLRGDGNYLGVVSHPPASARTVAKTILCGWLAEVGRQAAWPLSNSTDDEADLQAIAQWLGWSRDDYEDLVFEAKRLMASPAFLRAFDRLSAALAQTNYLNCEGIKRALGIEHKTASAPTNDAMALVRRIENSFQDALAKKYAEEFS
jgi:hypothetical protein